MASTSDHDRPPRRAPGRGRVGGHIGLGRAGEDYAARHLTRQGWLILDRNWRCRSGELDIVALDGPELVACEVKTRASRAAGAALESVTPRKLRRLRHLMALWLEQRGGERLPVRIDAIGIHLHPSGTYSIEHVKGVQPWR